MFAAEAAYNDAGALPQEVVKLQEDLAAPMRCSSGCSTSWRSCSGDGGYGPTARLAVSTRLPRHRSSQWTKVLNTLTATRSAEATR